jgi:hypothetical protein
MVVKTVFASRKSWWALGARVLDLVEGCSHVGIFHPMSNGDYMVSDMTGDGFNLRPQREWLKKYKIRAVVHTQIPNPNESWANSLVLLDHISLKFGADIYKLQYAHAQLFWDALEIVTQWFGGPEWKLYLNGKRKQVCSEWAARYHDAFGLWSGDKHFDLITLKDCYNGLKKIAIKVEGDL